MLVHLNNLLQYLENSRRLEDQTGIANALSNLGVLSKMLALHAYQTALKNGQNKPDARDVLHVHLQRAVSYFEQHLGVVEELEDL